MTDRPADLHLVGHREVRWVLVPTLAIAAFGVAAWGLAVATGEADGADWSTAWAGVGLLSIIGFVMWVVLSLWLRTNERRHAEAVLADAVVAWPQYSTPAQWDKDVEATVEHLRADPLQVVGPAAVLSAAVVVIAAVAAVTGDAGPAIALGAVALAIVWLLAGATVALRTLISKRSQERTRRRLGSIEPYPRCWVADEGAYFEDSGLIRFHRLSAVDVVEPGQVSAHRKELKRSGRTTGMLTDLTPLDTRLSRSGWALLAVTSDSTKAHTFWLKVERALRRAHQRHDWVDTVHVRVPPDALYDAHDLAARISRRWFGNR